MINLWLEVRRPICAGAQMEVLRLRCEQEGVSIYEVWDRVLSVDGVVSAYAAALRGEY